MDDVRQDYCIFIAIVFSFQCIGKVVNKFLTPNFLPKTEAWRWKNHAVSCIHGLIAGSWGCMSLIMYPNILLDPGTFHNDFAYYMVLFCSGYFMYDFIDHILNKKALEFWEVTLHHIAVISIFWHNWHMKIFIGYSVIALLTEANSFFLHARKLLRMYKVEKENAVYRILIQLNFISFIIFRIFPIIRVLMGCFAERNRHPALAVTIATVSTVLVAIVNIVLFWRLVKTDFLLSNLKKRKEQDTNLVNNNLKTE